MSYFRSKVDEFEIISQEGWQSLSCLTDSTEQSAPINFDMSNRVCFYSSYLFCTKHSLVILLLFTEI